jgi:glycine/D-amino acid oxidase-like deaminating enzyme
LNYDVVIAGAGPVGLFLACELGLAGTSVLVLERTEDPHSPLKAGWMGMRGLNIPSVDAFYRRGMLKEVRHSPLAWMAPAEKPGIELNQPNASSAAPAPRFAGHFAGIMLDPQKLICPARSISCPVLPPQVGWPPLRVLKRFWQNVRSS